MFRETYRELQAHRLARKVKPWAPRRVCCTIIKKTTWPPEGIQQPQPKINLRRVIKGFALIVCQRRVSPNDNPRHFLNKQIPVLKFKVEPPEHPLMVARINQACCVGESEMVRGKMKWRSLWAGTPKTRGSRLADTNLAGDVRKTGLLSTRTPVSVWTAARRSLRWHGSVCTAAMVLFTDLER